MHNRSIHINLFVQLFAAIISVCSASAQFNAAENVPVDFYGKVIDQNGQPVIGAKIAFDFIVSHMAENRTETKPMILQTDESGKFVLTGVTGYAIDKLSIRKQGYELSPKTRRGYVFGLDPDYHPSLSHPVVFTMWKQQGKEPLVGSSWHGRVSCDGTSNRYDLYTGKPSADGSLEIICSRDPINLPPANTKPYTYEIQISVLGGGIEATEDQFTYLAPRNGYGPTVTFGQFANSPHWDRNTPIPKEFYIKTPEGHYGTLSVDWDVAYTPSPTHLEWKVSINPSGSRNLER